MATLLLRLGTASIEAAAATLVVLAASALLLRRAPRAVALLWLVVLAKPLLSLAGGGFAQIPLPLQPVTREVRAEVVKMHTPDRGVVTRVRHDSNDPTPLLLGLWLTGALFVLGRTLRNRRRLHAIVAATRPPSPRLAAAFARLTDGRSSAPRLGVTDRIDGPAIGGLLHPTILMPAWMETAGDAEIAWTLRHELRHAAARDTAAIALRELALILFWFHPAIWLAAKRWEAAAELACDRDVVGSDAEAVDYADALYRTLLNVRQQRRVTLAAGLFATRSKIGVRIAALVERPLAPKGGWQAAVAAGALALAVIAVGARVGWGPHHHRGNIEEANAGRRYTLDFEGVFDAAAPAESLQAGGFIEMRETAGGVTRVLRLDGTPHGVARTYRIDGRAAPPDPAFERRMLAEVRRVSRV